MVLTVVPVVAWAALPPTQLLVEFLPSPVLGVDTLLPRFSWATASATRNATSMGYQLQVSELLSGYSHFDSGRVVAPRSASVEYNGAALSEDTSYRWRVRWWSADTGDQPSDWSDYAVFHIGLVNGTWWDRALSIHVQNGRRPPSPVPLCKVNCEMLGLKDNYYFAGSYNETQVHSVDSITECQQSCLVDQACVQITWAPSHRDKCVMYSSITSKMNQGAAAWVKCHAKESSVEACTGLDPTPSGPAPAQLMRAEFQAPPDVRAAFLYLSAVGWASAWINGVEIAPGEVLNPGRTTFDMRQFYETHNVTERILPGHTNAIGILAASGWQSMPGHQLSVRAVLIMVDKNGARHMVPTSTAWTGTDHGPITGANIYSGQTYDAKLESEVEGWASVNYSRAGSWLHCLEVNEFHITPSWQPMQPIRKLELNNALTVTPIKLLRTNETVYVYKFPQNAAGTSRLTVQGCPAGAVLTVYYSENLCGYGTTRWSPPCAPGQPPGDGQTGTVDPRNYRTSESTTYTCKGAPIELYEPSFWYTGFRFAELHGHVWGTPGVDTLQQRVIHSDVEGISGATTNVTIPRRLSGSLAFGSIGHSAPDVDGPLCYEGEGCDGSPPTNSTIAVLDQISHNVRWDLIDNLHSVPEDCDQRNERWGWMADASVSAEANYNYHWVPALYSSWLQAMRDVQQEPSATCASATGTQGDTNVVDGKAECAGAVGDLTPGRTPAQLPGDPSWMFAYPLLYSYQTRYCEDARTAQRLWPGIRDYTAFLFRMAKRGKSGLVSWKKYGDWLEPGRVASIDIIGEMSSSFNYGQTLRIARDAASVLGNDSAAAEYQKALTTVQHAFHDAYWDPNGKTYGDGSQPALTYALYLGAVPAEHEDSVFSSLLETINRGTKECDSTPCLGTGILATKWIMELLSLRGRTDIGLDLAFKTDFPSWGYMAAMNATTIWEHWEYMNGNGMNSHAHPALASVGAWLYRWVLGLRLHKPAFSAAPPTQHFGWRRVLFSPGCTFDPRLPRVRGRVTTLYGPIEASWANESNSLVMNVSIPPDVECTVQMPSVNSAVRVMESGKLIWSAGSRQSQSLGNQSLEARVLAKPPRFTVGSGDWFFRMDFA